jgi:hypothetical protein
MQDFQYRYQDNSFLSDHAPQCFDTHEFGNVITWNILQQCSSFLINGEYVYNNGFSTVETKEQYISRLDKVAEFLANSIRSNDHVNVICLQEFQKLGKLNKEEHQKIIDMFLNHINKYGNFGYTYSNNSDNIIFYNKSNLNLINTGEDVENIVNTHVAIHSNRFDIASFQYQDESVLNVCSVHLVGFDTQNKDMEAIRVKETAKILDDMMDNYQGHYLIVGDFNYNINGYSSDFHNAKIQVEENTTLTAPIHGHCTEWYNTCDGFIYV